MNPHHNYIAEMRIVRIITTYSALESSGFQPRPRTPFTLTLFSFLFFRERRPRRRVPPVTLDPRSHPSPAGNLYNDDGNVRCACDARTTGANYPPPPPRLLPHLPLSNPATAHLRPLPIDIATTLLYPTTPSISTGGTLPALRKTRG